MLSSVGGAGSNAGYFDAQALRLDNDWFGSVMAGVGGSSSSVSALVGTTVGYIGPVQETCGTRAWTFEVGVRWLGDGLEVFAMPKATLVVRQQCN